MIDSKYDGKSVRFSVLVSNFKKVFRGLPQIEHLLELDMINDAGTFDLMVKDGVTYYSEGLVVVPEEIVNAIRSSNHHTFDVIELG